MNTIQPECQSSDIVRKQILDSAEEIFSVMQQRESPENVQRIRDAFIFADEAHKLQRRKSGEPYIIHPGRTKNKVFGDHLYRGATVNCLN